MRLNLGCSDRSIDSFIGVDIAAGPGVDQVADLSKPWPWETPRFLVKTFDVIEHIADRIHFMNELHRVLAPGGQAHIEVPNAAKGAGFAQDPTHVSHWCMNSFQYFRSQSFAHQRLSKAYGITASFNVLRLDERMYQDEFEEVWKITAILEAVK